MSVFVVSGAELVEIISRFPVCHIWPMVSIIKILNPENGDEDDDEEGEESQQEKAPRTSFMGMGMKKDEDILAQIKKIQGR